MTPKELQDELAKRAQNFDPKTATVFTSDMTREEIVAKIMGLRGPKLPPT